MTRGIQLQFAHVGINCDSEVEAREVADLFKTLFGTNIREGSSSIFVDSAIEVTKSPYRGMHGHLAFATDDIDAMVCYLEDHGVSIIEGSQKYKDDRLVTVYLDVEIAGFAVHLLATE